MLIVITPRVSKAVRAWLLIGGSFFLAGNRGCDVDRVTQCQGEFAELAAEVSEFRAGGFDPETRERCQHWARKRLTEVQLLLDVMMREPGRRPAAIDLNQIATDLVMVHGACEKGDAVTVDRELASLEKGLPLVQEKACAPSLPTSDRVNP